MEKVRLIILDRETGKACQHIPLSIGAIVRQWVQDSDNPDGVERIENHHLGMIASNHVGYLSISVDGLSRNKAIENGVIVGFDIRIIGADSSQTYDISADKLDTVHPILIDRVDLNKPISGSILPSIPQPDLLDWKLSPNSFGTSDTSILDADGCETLLPSNVVDRLFAFSEIIKRPDLPTNNYSRNGRLSDDTITVKHGRLLNYEMTWLPINHGLGQVLYSLTLAPCEVVNIALIDWSREDTTRRDETTGVSESLLHDQRRDRIVDEAVEAMVEEFQKGKSLLGGTAGVGGYGMGSWGVTGSHAIGIGRSESEGERSSSASTIQNLSDRIAQASNTLRELRSTVVVQAGQRERETTETRTVRNHNHCHALTILYYEVVRHYCVSTKLATTRDVVFVDYSDQFIDDFTVDHVVNQRRLLEQYLIDSRLLSYFDAMERLAYDYEDLSEAPQEPEEYPMTSVMVDIRTGDNGSDKDIYFRMQLVNGEIWEKQVNPPGNPFESNSTTSQRFTTADDLPNVPLHKVFRVGVRFDTNLADWTIAGLLVQVSDTQESTIHILYDSQIDANPALPLPHKFERDGEWWGSTIEHDRTNPITEEYAARVATRDHDRGLAQKLLDHLNANKYFYNKLLWIYEDPDRRAARFDQYIDDGQSLLDKIDNHILGISGQYVIFASGDLDVHVPSENTPIYPVERIISVPTRGAFAESKLSHCNACEKIDDTRFWKWEESPCPDIAPQISNIEPSSRFQQATGVTLNQPTSSIGIEATSEAPDPTGLSDILDLLKTPDIFRDMSGIEQLGSLLETLTQAAAEVEGKRLEQQGETEREKIKAESSSDDTGTSESNDGATSSRPSSTSSTSPSSENGSSASGQTSEARSIISEGQGFREILNQGIDEGWITEDFAGEQYRTFAQNAVSTDATTVTDVPGNDWWENLEPARDDTFDIQVAYSPSYDVFRRRVAQSSQIASRMISRSDPDYAESVIDRRPDLRDIHNGFTDAGVAEESVFTIIAHMIKDDRGYVLVIRFIYPSVDFEPDTITVDTLRIRAAEIEKLGHAFDDLVTRVLSESHTFLGLPDSHGITLSSVVSIYANNIIRLSRGERTLIPYRTSQELARPIVVQAESDWNSLTDSGSVPALIGHDQEVINHLRLWARNVMLEHGNTTDPVTINRYIELINGYRNY